MDEFRDVQQLNLLLERTDKLGKKYVQFKPIYDLNTSLNNAIAMFRDAINKQGLGLLGASSIKTIASSFSDELKMLSNDH
jgi:hypothetical protein